MVKKMRELADKVGILKSPVHRILAENLNMRKLYGGWLTMEEKQRRKDVLIEYLTIFHSIEADFLRPFITMEETWFHHFTPETKEQSKSLS